MKTFLMLFFLLTAMVVNAQLGMTKQDITTKYGTDYSSGVSEDGFYYIYYSIPTHTASSGTYDMIKSMYFTTLDDGSLVCFTWRVIDPISEANDNISFFNSQFVKIGDLKWKDYETDIVYQVTIKTTICIIDVFYE